MAQHISLSTLGLNALVSKSASRTKLWVRILRLLGSEVLAEVGVGNGEFAEEILWRCKAVTRYYLIDPWAHLSDWNKPDNLDTAAFERIRTEALERTSFAADKLTILRGRTNAVIDQVPDGSLDFAYIDGDHTLRGITIDLIKVLPKIKEGGIIGGDDFVNTAWQHDTRFEPTLVCPFAVYFAEAMDIPIVALPYDQFLIQKSTDSSFSFVDMAGIYSDLSLNNLVRVRDRTA